ncbi:assimilatory nitrate reductase catalytic subunit [Actinopolyspora lacussalsi subsp. righensis]|uniref:Assimilatory nitrate reductase catalytic subunit n=1 Tax=Actinopolyspora righensis TaxID=995060 RepID=A0A1I7BHJ9_9ACTN|nr:molybdopterin oxidoreductase family protein [Actinopolyspora righensis]SFT86648.1 assimilatory nitrate reductase catalytic subunit [Actinopolyspora righensis]
MARHQVATHCPYCALQCGTELTDREGAVSVSPSSFPVNRGGLCRKGWTAPEVLGSADRLYEPQLRIGRGELAPVGWEEVLDRIATNLEEIIAESGPDAVGIFGGGGLTNEKAYALGKFARVALGSSRIDYNGRFCMAAAATAGNAAFGVDRGLPFPVTDLGEAEVILLAGGNPAETMPPLMQHLEGARLVVVDPRRSATAERAELHLRPRPGTDLALALGLLHIAVTEGWHDSEYTARRTTGFERTWARAVTWWPERVERVTGVPVSAQRQAVRMLARARSSYVLTGRGAEQHGDGADTVSGFINLALALGLPGTRGSGYGCLTGQGNGQGGREHGQKADQLPGYRSITDPAARAHVAEVWGVAEKALPGPGLPATRLLESAGTPEGIRALLVFGANPVLSAPHAGLARAQLSKLDLLVVADFLPSETTRMADVVLPVTQWAEEEGTMTNLEGRVLRRRALLPPPGSTRSDLDVLRGLATRLGQPESRFPTRPSTVFDELAHASAGGPADYSGIDYERLDSGQALHWPCPKTPDEQVPTPHPGTPRLFLESFAHPDGRARFAAVDWHGPAEDTNHEYPLVATTGRISGHYQTGEQTRRVDELATAEPESFVRLHPDTAARRGVHDGQLARVSSARGATLARARLDDSIRPDTLFLPIHYAGAGCANLLTNPVLDPRSGIPEFKVAAVSISSAEEPSA